MQPGEVGELSFSVSGNDVSELSPNIERHATAIVSVTPPDFFLPKHKSPENGDTIFRSSLCGHERSIEETRHCDGGG
jgi:hypothetical protein